MIHEDIKKGIKEAMIAKDALRLSVLRSLLSGFTNELVATKRTPQEMLTDEEALKVITRQVKQRKDSIEQFIGGGRPELAESEKEELALLEAFLPEMMSADEIRKVAEAKKAETGTTNKADAGKLTGIVMKELKGKADGTVVKQVVESLFE